MVALLHTQAESGAHWTHLPGVPAQTGVAVGQGVSTQLPAAEQVLNTVVLAHLGGAVGLQPTHAPLTQAVEPATLQEAVAKAPWLQ